MARPIAQSMRAVEARCRGKTINHTSYGTLTQGLTWMSTLAGVLVYDNWDTNRQGEFAGQVGMQPMISALRCRGRSQHHLNLDMAEKQELSVASVSFEKPDGMPSVAPGLVAATARHREVTYQKDRAPNPHSKQNNCLGYVESVLLRLGMKGRARYIGPKNPIEQLTDTSETVGNARNYRLGTDTRR